VILPHFKEDGGLLVVASCTTKSSPKPTPTTKPNPKRKAPEEVAHCKQTTTTTKQKTNTTQRHIASRKSYRADLR
jgi:hypothetical protein